MLTFVTRYVCPGVTKFEDRDVEFLAELRKLRAVRPPKRKRKSVAKRPPRKKKVTDPRVLALMPHLSDAQKEMLGIE